MVFTEWLDGNYICWMFFSINIRDVTVEMSNTIASPIYLMLSIVFNTLYSEALSVSVDRHGEQHDSESH